MWVLCMVGAAQEAVACFLFALSHKFKKYDREVREKQSRHANGTVAGNERREQRRRRPGKGAARGYRKVPVYYPVIRFQSDDGTEVEKAAVYGTGTIVYKEGESVDVWYDPASPGDFHLASHSGMMQVAIWTPFAVGMMCAVVGAAFLCGGILFMLLEGMVQ